MTLPSSINHHHHHHHRHQLTSSSAARPTNQTHTYPHTHNTNTYLCSSHDHLQPQRQRIGTTRQQTKHLTAVHLHELHQLGHLPLARLCTEARPTDTLQQSSWQAKRSLTGWLLERGNLCCSDRAIWLLRG